MGEGLGHNEAIDGLPFRPRGAAGSLLEQVFRICRTDRSQFLIDNIIRCQPPNDNLHGFGYEYDAIQHCTKAYSHRVYGDSRVRAILALGAIAFRNITGISGKKQNISDLRGYVVRNDKFSVPIVGSYHPAHIRRGKLAYTDYLIHDLRKVMGVANGSYKSYCSIDNYKHNYILNPSIDDAKSYFYKIKDSPQVVVAYDIETPNSADMSEDEREEILGEQILSIQFSTGKGDGIYLPWEGNYIKVAQAILRRENTKLVFNGWNFDNPKLLVNRCEIKGRNIDVMWGFHYLKPDLEMNLQSVASMCDWPMAWKFLAQDPRMQRLYGCFDVDSLHWIWPKIDGIMGSMKVPQ